MKHWEGYSKPGDHECDLPSFSEYMGKIPSKPRHTGDPMRIKGAAEPTKADITRIVLYVVLGLSVVLAFYHIL